MVWCGRDNAEGKTSLRVCVDQAFDPSSFCHSPNLITFAAGIHLGLRYPVESFAEPKTGTYLKMRRSASAGQPLCGPFYCIRPFRWRWGKVPAFVPHEAGWGTESSKPPSDDDFDSNSLVVPRSTRAGDDASVDMRRYLPYTPWPTIKRWCRIRVS
jgi:hypothetical protein